MKLWRGATTIIPLVLLPLLTNAKVFDAESIDYCNFHAEAKTIPPINDHIVTAKDLRLQQVQVVARHGSRTPYTGYQCWSNYDFKWDCNVTDLSLPSDEPHGDDRDYAWMFRKKYDGHTVLGGSCHLGQLVSDGYQQEATNGRILKDAYIGEGPLKLFVHDDLTKLHEKYLYLRSDDDPSFRTEMSGEVLLGGMFSRSQRVNLQWHVGDYELDDIYPNYHVCPRLAQIEQEAWSSQEWKDYNESAPIAKLRSEMEKALPGYQFNVMLDCLMTTACTGRPFPDTLDRDTFDKAVDYSSKWEAFPFIWNGSYYSQLAMGPLALTLLDNMDRRVHGSSEVKFGLFLGHDTTLLPLLAAMGVWDKAEESWPTYAALLSVELYDSNQGNVVRIVYRGKELALPGCDNQVLCPLSKFKESVMSWALGYHDRPCEALPSLNLDGDAASQQRMISSDNGMSSSGSNGHVSSRVLAACVFVSAVAGLVLGVFGTLVYNAQRRYRRLSLFPPADGGMQDIV